MSTLASAAANTDKPQSNYVIVSGKLRSTRNIFPLTRKELIATLDILEDSTRERDMAIAARLRDALTYLDHYNENTNEPIMVLKIVVSKEANRRRLEELCPHDDDEL